MMCLPQERCHGCAGGSEGKEGMEDDNHAKELKSTAACTIRLSEAVDAAESRKLLKVIHGLAV